MYKVYAITDIGNERQQNQDGFVVDGICCVNVEHREVYYETDADYIHVAICDGVGSTRFATYAVQKAEEYICNHLKIHNENELEKLIVDMNAYVYKSAKADNKEDCATTIVGIVMVEDKAFVYNIGDSSAYSVNNGYLEKQTVDDTGVALFGEREGTDEIGMQVKPPLFQSIGTNELIDLVHIRKLSNNKAFLICSDGITDMLSIDEMEDILETSDSLKEIAQSYVAAANMRGGYDNSTVILLVDEEE